MSRCDCGEFLGDHGQCLRGPDCPQVPCPACRRPMAHHDETGRLCPTELGLRLIEEMEAMRHLGLRVPDRALQLAVTATEDEYGAMKNWEAVDMCIALASVS